VAHFGALIRCARAVTYFLTRLKRTFPPLADKDNFRQNRNLCDRRIFTMADKLDPFDVEALGDAVNDSASRVSTIWVTFLIFSLYMLVAAGTVTQRQLFLDEPTTLPVLNIDLPLWWFFMLAPVLFVILHVYVLLQVLLLGRTAVAYNAAVTRFGLSPEENVSLRQRLTNTLFAQILAGSPREREGFVGALLKIIVWITLAAAPILIVVAIQFRFLPYHSHIVTWTHRILILIELAAFFLIWPLALDARRDFQWPRVGSEQWRRGQVAPLAACLLYIIVSLLIATFPGEPHVNLLTLRPILSIQCDGWRRLGIQFDRLELQNTEIFNENKPSVEERTQNLRGRDFNCSNLSSLDLHGVNLTGATLVGANLAYTVLTGASLDSALLEGASLSSTQLQGATLASAQMQGAYLAYSQLQGANFTDAQLQGADLQGAQLQGAYLADTALQAADLQSALLQGAELQGAQLEGAFLGYAQLKGTDLWQADLKYSDLSHAYTWRTMAAACMTAEVVNHQAASVIDQPSTGFAKPIPATTDEISKFIERSVIKIPDPSIKQRVVNQMHLRLDTELAPYDSDDVWNACEEAATKVPEGTFDDERATTLRNVICNSTQIATVINIMNEWIGSTTGFLLSRGNFTFSAQVARKLLVEGGDCPAKGFFDETTMHRLRDAAAEATPAPATPVTLPSPPAAPPTPPAAAPPSPPLPSSATRGQ
jgi:uncharacterized protein YjbI with pentapeptide repeats